MDGSAQHQVVVGGIQLVVGCIGFMIEIVITFETVQMKGARSLKSPDWPGGSSLWQAGEGNFS
jgi:hypothetical protein